jgi:hypothetical protein
MAIESLVIDIFYITPTPSPTPAPPQPAQPTSAAGAPTVAAASPTMAAAADPMAAGVSGVANGTAAAVGDPHLQNVFGERFELMRPGKHVLIHLPRGERVESVLLRVEAEARRLGGQCTDMYFQEISITGDWVEKKYHRGGMGLRFQAQRVHDETPSWITFGKVQVKVTHGRTQQGVHYLNFHVKNLGRAGLVVGGLLGADDHTEAALPSNECIHKISLLQTAVMDEHVAPVSSIAEASFA